MEEISKTQQRDALVCPTIHCFGKMGPLRTLGSDMADINPKKTAQKSERVAGSTRRLEKREFQDEPALANFLVNMHSSTPPPPPPGLSSAARKKMKRNDPTSASTQGIFLGHYDTCHICSFNVGNAMHAVRTQCEVLNVGQYSDPTFGPF